MSVDERGEQIDRIIFGSHNSCTGNNTILPRNAGDGDGVRFGRIENDGERILFLRIDLRNNSAGVAVVECVCDMKKCKIVGEHRGRYEKGVGIAFVLLVLL